ncbi:DUF1232 domain-containing protein [Desulfurispirillum indicum]|uniref:YkvA family protein n=1 Tax=Desulfurispirillum indicum TaxID=936456 RepID=UPI001CFA55A9|nr:YkvA family protein [Desulfurispirillum indicum]UCZ57126.1 DUF1232 domain-containing protein [Desulfurispirillum indicum]
MPNFLSDAAMEYANWLRDASQENIDFLKVLWLHTKEVCVSPFFDYNNQKTAENFHKIFPDITAEKMETLKEMVDQLIELIPLLTVFSEDCDNILSDRLLVTSALCYLIAPFDLIPDELGIVGAVDDTIVCYRISESLEAPSDEIALWINKSRPIVQQAERLLPDWLLESLSGVVKNAIQQQRSLLAANIQREGK